MDLTSYSKIRRVVIILLLGIIALLIFSVYALYLHYYTYEMSSEPVEHEYDPYVEFFVTTGSTNGTIEYVPGTQVNVTLGAANFLREQQNLTVVIWNVGSNESYEHKNLFILDHGKTTRKDIPIPFDLNGTVALKFQLYDKKMTPLEEREVTMIPV